MGSTFDSRGVRSWIADASVRDILNVDAIDAYCEELIREYVPGGTPERGSRDDMTIAWIRSTYRAHLIRTSALRLIVTPREAKLRSLESNRYAPSVYDTFGFRVQTPTTPIPKIFVADPASLPEWALEKIHKGYELYWWEAPLFMTVSKKKWLERVIRFVRFKAKVNGHVRDTVETIERALLERKRKAQILWMLRERSWDTEPVESTALRRAGLYAVLLKTKHAYVREGFLMRNCLHSSWVGTSRRVWSVRKEGQKRPVGSLMADLHATSKNWTFTSFCGFANKAAPVQETAIRQFGIELQLKSVPNRVNYDHSSAAQMWAAYGAADHDFEVTRGSAASHLSEVSDEALRRGISDALTRDVPARRLTIGEDISVRTLSSMMDLSLGAGGLEGHAYVGTGFSFFGENQGISRLYRSERIAETLRTDRYTPIVVDSMAMLEGLERFAAQHGVQLDTSAVDSVDENGQPVVPESQGDFVLGLEMPAGFNRDGVGWDSSPVERIWGESEAPPSACNRNTDTTERPSFRMLPHRREALRQAYARFTQGRPPISGNIPRRERNAHDHPPRTELDTPSSRSLTEIADAIVSLTGATEPEEPRPTLRILKPRPAGAGAFDFDLRLLERNIRDLLRNTT